MSASECPSRPSPSNSTPPRMSLRPGANAWTSYPTPIATPGPTSERARSTSREPVILKFPSSPGTSVTGSPSRSTRRHSSVASAAAAPASAKARRSSEARNPCGVWASHSVRRSRVAATRSPSARFTVSVAGSAASAAPPRAAAMATARTRSGVANGRAASCTRTRSHPGSASRPARTESARAAPPGTTRVGRPRPASSPAPRASSPAGTTATISSTRSQAASARAARRSTLSPPSSSHCLAVPARRPDPPAARMAPTLSVPITRSSGAGLAPGVLCREPLPRARIDAASPDATAARPGGRAADLAGARPGRGVPGSRPQLMLKIFRSSVSTSCSSQSFAMASSLMRRDRAVSSIFRSPKDRSLSERRR